MTESEYATVLLPYPDSANSLIEFSCSQEISKFLGKRLQMNLESYCLPNFLEMKLFWFVAIVGLTTLLDRRVVSKKCASNSTMHIHDFFYFSGVQCTSFLLPSLRHTHHHKAYSNNKRLKDCRISITESLTAYRMGQWKRHKMNMVSEMCGLMMVRFYSRKMVRKVQSYFMGKWGKHHVELWKRKSFLCALYIFTEV